MHDIRWTDKVYLDNQGNIRNSDGCSTYKSPCDYCIELECEHNGNVCPLWEKYNKEGD